MGKFLVAQLEEENLNELLALHLKIFPVRMNMDIMREFYRSQAILALCMFYVDGESKELIGVSTARRTWRTFFSTDRTSYLCTFGIDPKFRQHHLGTDLLRITCHILRDHFQTKEITLHMQRINKPALQLYKKFGFSIVRSYPGYYDELQDEAQDALYMSMSLENHSWTFTNELEFTDDVQDLFSVVPPLEWLDSILASP